MVRIGQGAAVAMALKRQESNVNGADDDDDEEVRDLPPIRVSDLNRDISQWPVTRKGYSDLMVFTLIFFVYVVMASLQLNAGASFSMDNAHRSKFGGALNSVFNLDDWWKYMYGSDGDGSVLDVLFESTWYNGKAFSSNEGGFVLMYNKLVGGVLITQQRRGYSSDGCVNIMGPTSYDKFYQDCFLDSINSYNASEKSFGEHYASLSTNEQLITQGAWTYQNLSSGGGYSLFFSLAGGRKQAIAQLKALQKGLWLDKATRSIVVKFALYNGQIGPGVFSFCIITFDYDHGGIYRWNNDMQFQSINMEPYRGTATDYFKLFLEIIFLVWLAQQCVNFVIMCVGDVKYGGVGSLVQTWTVVDAAFLGMLVSYCFLRGKILYITFKNPITVPTNVYQTTLEDIANVQQSQIIVTFFSLIVFLLRFMKYMEFQPRLNVVNKTIANAITDLYHFLIVYITIVLAYSMMGHFLFGATVPTWSSTGQALATTTRMMFMDFDFVSIAKVNPYMAPVFFASYMFLIVFLLLNVLVGILVDAYVNAISPDSATLGKEMGMFPRRLWFAITRRRGVTDKDILEAMHDLSRSGKEYVTVLDISKAMKKTVGNKYGKWLNRSVASHPSVLDELASTNIDVLKPTWNRELLSLFEGALRENTLLRLRYQAKVFSADRL